MIDLEGTLRELQYAEGIFYDDTVGVAGTAPSVGTRTHPSNTPADVITLCARYRTNVIHVRGTFTIGATMSGYTFVADGDHSDDIIVLNAQIANETVFKGLTLQGALGLSSIYCYDCNISVVTNFQGTATRCRLSTSMTLVTGAYTSNFVDCYSLAAFTMTVNQHTVVITNWGRGPLTLATVSNAGSAVTIDGKNWTPVTIAASCTLGTIGVSGDIHLTNLTGGSVVTDRSTPNNVLAVNTTVAARNLYGGVATSGEVGADIYNLAVTERSKIGFLAISMINCNSGFAGPVVTVRAYTTANAVESKFFEQAFTKGNTPGGGAFGGDPDLIVVVDSEMRFNGYLRIEMRSNYLSDTAVSVPVKIL